MEQPGQGPVFRLGEVFPKEEFIRRLKCSDKTWKRYRQAGLRPIAGCKTHYFLVDDVVKIGKRLSDEEGEGEDPR